MRIWIYRNLVSFISFVFVAHCCFAGLMEDTGNTQPVPYYKFDLPAESLTIAKKFLPQNPVIVDAGAFDGWESVLMAKFWPKGHVHSFEPVPELYQKVAARSKRIKNMTAYMLALGGEVGKKEMYLSNESDKPDCVSMSSSLLPPKDHLLYAATVFSGKICVNVTTLDRWAEERGIGKVDMLWLDMQGAELFAIKASPKVLSQVSVILTELEFVEAYEKQPLYLEVKAYLEKECFVLIGSNFTFPKDPNQWFGDGLFIRKELVNSQLGKACQ